MAKRMATLCDHPECLSQADNVCVLCDADLCKAHHIVPQFMVTVPGPTTRTQPLIPVTHGFCRSCETAWAVLQGFHRVAQIPGGAASGTHIANAQRLQDWYTAVFAGVWEAMRAYMTEFALQFPQATIVAPLSSDTAPGLRERVDALAMHLSISQQQAKLVAQLLEATK